MHTKFWIIEVESLPETAITVKSLDKYPTPVLISEFIDNFNFRILKKSHFFTTFKVVIAKTVTLHLIKTNYYVWNVK